MIEEVNITLTKYEAVLLLEFVAQLNKSENVQDMAEQRALWNFECLLEKGIPEVFSEKYADILEEARKNIK